jgi:hypothetical protein
MSGRILRLLLLRLELNQPSGSLTVGGDCLFPRRSGIRSGNAKLIYKPSLCACRVHYIRNLDRRRYYLAEARASAAHCSSPSLGSLLEIAEIRLDTLRK